MDNEIVANDGSVRITRLTLGQWDTNAYIITCLETGACVLVDAPADAPQILLNLGDGKLKCILLTHNHRDHTGALPVLKALGIPVCAHAADSSNLPSPPEIRLEDGDNITVGNIMLGVLHTPGHTPGSLCFRTGRYLICGDTIFPGGPGKTASPEQFHEIIKSIQEKILTLPHDTELHPGHGQSTTVLAAKAEFAVFSARTHDPNLCGDVLWQ